MSELRELTCSILRGGTSKGVFLLEDQLPPPGERRDAVLKAVMGSPDRRQINGLGGADILTSKVAIIGKSDDPAIDVRYTFAQVGIEQDIVNYDGNCGNIAAAVGPFAMEHGFANSNEGITKISVFNTNVKKILTIEVPVQNKQPKMEGDFKIAGVPGAGAKVMVDFSKTAGSLTGKLFPTGNKCDLLDVNGFGKVEVSILDLANPVVFVRAEAFGMVGTEMPAEVESDKARIDLFESLRQSAARMIGMKTSPFVPFFCTIGAPASYARFGDGGLVSQHDCDLVSRLVGFGRMHKAYPGTGAACIAVASRIKGTVVSSVLQNDSISNCHLLKIGHPSGVMDVEIEMNNDEEPKRVAIGRTWKKIMEGKVFIPERYF